MVSMADSIEFSQKVIDATEAKIDWYNSNVMPELTEDYRLFLACIKNLYDLLIKRSMIKPDPYKLDRKISGIKPLDNSPFTDGERQTVIGARFSEFETMLDWICTYYKFSIDSLAIPEIKKIVDFNNTFLWNSLSPNNTMPNTRGLGQIIFEMKRGADPLTSSSINDILSKIQKTTGNIAKTLKDVSEFQREVYKYKIRAQIIKGGKLDESKAFSSPEEEVAQIKKNFTSAFGREPFYTQLVEEIAREDQGPGRDDLQAALLAKLAIEEQKKKKGAPEVDTKEMLLEAIHSLCAQVTPLSEAFSKINENNETLKSAGASFMAKLVEALKKAFNVPDKPVEYDLVIVDQSTNARKKQTVNFAAFSAEIQKKMNFYNSFSLKSNAGFKKFQVAEEAKLIDFLNKQITDLQKTLVLLKAFDDFFKNNTSPEKRSKIKGLSMEIMAIKNNLVNTNQRRADYISYVEEQEQMKKLGIQN